MTASASGAVSLKIGKDWKVIDKPGNFAWISKYSLNVDHSYQRKLKKHRLIAMARRWSWLGCGVLLVAWRTDGSYYIIDGQHRWQAALRCDHVDKLPCMVFEVEGLRSESRGFLYQTTHRSIPVLDRYRALLTEGDAAALHLQSLLDRYGYEATAGGGSHQRNVLSAIERALVYVKRNGPAFDRVFSILAELCRDGQIQSTILGALFCIEEHMPPGESLTDRRWKQRILSLGLNALVKGAIDASSYYGALTPSNAARGVVRTINKNLRGNKLTPDIPDRDKE